MSRPPLNPEWSPPYRAASSPPQLKVSPEQGSEWVFRVSSELLCPISHEVFSNPVINVAGQIYERANIEQHFLRHNTDPVTGSRLQSKLLTPVYSLKSRAAEFREAAARHCVEVASAVGTVDAVRYVRRACELCEALTGPIPGLSVDCMDYIRRHPSNVYDTAVMHSFAESLCSAGQRDKAAAVYFTLLQAGDDRVQQAEMLCKFVSCWNESEFQSAEERRQESVTRLVELLHQSSNPTPAHLVSIAQEANLGHAFLSGLCEQYLSISANETVDEKFFDPREWNRQKYMMLQYIRLCCDHVSSQLQESSLRMEKVLEVGEELRAALAERGQDEEPVVARSPETRPGSRSKLHWSAAVCLVASSILRPELVGVRIAKAMSIAVLLHHR